MRTLLLAILISTSAFAQNKGTPIAQTGIPAPMLYDNGDPITLAYPCDASHTGIAFYNLTSSITRPIWVCNGTTWIQAQSAISGTTVSIGGSILILGGTTSGTGTVTGAAVGSNCIATPSDGTIVLGVTTYCQVATTGVVTVTLQATIAGTPAAKTYNVRVLQ